MEKNKRIDLWNEYKRKRHEYVKGGRSECSNYRGISLLSVPGKVYGRILTGGCGMGVGGRGNIDPDNLWRDLDQIWHAGFPHTPGKVIGYGVGVAGRRDMGVSGRANIDPGNSWRDLDHTWLGGSPHHREGHRLCGYVVGLACGCGKGVDGRGNIDAGNGWRDLD